MALDSDAWREEIFGPVVCARPLDTEEEAIRLANDSHFGLAAAVMAADDARAERVTASITAMPDTTPQGQAALKRVLGVPSLVLFGLAHRLVVEQ